MCKKFSFFSLKYIFLYLLLLINFYILYTFFTKDKFYSLCEIWFFTNLFLFSKFNLIFHFFHYLYFRISLFKLNFPFQFKLIFDFFSFDSVCIIYVCEARPVPPKKMLNTTLIFPDLTIKKLFFRIKRVFLQIILEFFSVFPLILNWFWKICSLIKKNL